MLELQVQELTRACIEVTAVKSLKSRFRFGAPGRLPKNFARRACGTLEKRYAHCELLPWAEA